MPTLDDVLALAAVAAGRLRAVAAADRLHLGVCWAHIAEIPEIPALPGHSAFPWKGDDCSVPSSGHRPPEVDRRAAWRGRPGCATWVRRVTHATRTAGVAALVGPVDDRGIRLLAGLGPRQRDVDVLAALATEVRRAVRGRLPEVDAETMVIAAGSLVGGPRDALPSAAGSAAAGAAATGP
jgi:hypothetical protein